MTAPTIEKQLEHCHKELDQMTAELRKGLIDAFCGVYNYRWADIKSVTHQMRHQLDQVDKLLDMLAERESDGVEVE